MKLLRVEFNCSIKLIVRWFSSRLILLGVSLKIQRIGITRLLVVKLILSTSLAALVNMITILLFQIQIFIGRLLRESIRKPLPSPIRLHSSELSHIGIGMTVLSLSPVLLQQVSVHRLNCFASQSFLSKRGWRVHKSKFLGFWRRYYIMNIIWNQIWWLWRVATHHWVILILN